MKLKLFTVYDSKTESYLRPFSLTTKGEALRGFQETVNDPQSQICKYPADFTLFELGEWDDQSASIIVLEAKINLGNALEFKTSKE
ncbi:MAG: nonstructural protein [Arizlama microvirus]|nr:MAG: nonstructural protein [Arizlama microvirus]